jgi:hypothetical protein
VSKSEVLLGRPPQRFTPAGAIAEPTHRGGVWPDLPINAARRRFGSILAQPDFPFVAVTPFTTVALGANSAPFNLRHRIKRAPWSFLNA